MSRPAADAPPTTGSRLRPPRAGGSRTVSHTGLSDTRTGPQTPLAPAPPPRGAAPSNAPPRTHSGTRPPCELTSRSCRARRHSPAPGMTAGPARTRPPAAGPACPGPAQGGVRKHLPAGAAAGPPHNAARAARVPGAQGARAPTQDHGPKAAGPQGLSLCLVLRAALCQAWFWALSTQPGPKRTKRPAVTSTRPRPHAWTGHVLILLWPECLHPPDL